LRHWFARRQQPLWWHGTSSNASAEARLTGTRNQPTTGTPPADKIRTMLPLISRHRPIARPGDFVGETSRQFSKHVTAFHPPRRRRW